ncbi:MAG TPA: barstar family protein [Myxococcus sp.]|nr:barstar family protein [Myxococcus sp.]
MREHSPRFRFVANPMLFRPEGGHVGRIPVGVSGKEQLMLVLEEALQLPDYFGRNCDALSDCLRDLSWLPPGLVSMVHDTLPDLSPKDLRIYVEVLATAVGNWQPRKNYALEVIFPESERHRVLDLLPP